MRLWSALNRLKEGLLLFAKIKVLHRRADSSAYMQSKNIKNNADVPLEESDRVVVIVDAVL